MGPVASGGSGVGRPGRGRRRRIATPSDSGRGNGQGDQVISKLSSGEQQRALLARALVQESSLFLLDEPLNAVDEATRDIVADVLQEHTRDGGTVLAATHDLGRLSESFDRAIYLRDGRIERTERMAGGTAARATMRHSSC